MYERFKRQKKPMRKRRLDAKNYADGLLLVESGVASLLSALLLWGFIFIFYFDIIVKCQFSSWIFDLSN